MKKQTHEEIKKNLNEKVIQEVLSDKYLSFTIDSLNICEDLTSRNTAVRFMLTVANYAGDEIKYDIEGEGKGLFDALFNVLLTKLVDDCHSLANLRLEEFYISVDEADLRKLRTRSLGADAHVEASMIIDNGNGKLIPFRSRNQSMIAASVDVVCKTIEFFVNSERAVLRLKQLIKDAEERSRGDLSARFTSSLSLLVFNTSYEVSLRDEI